jgi:hypothetical protein
MGQEASPAKQLVVHLLAFADYKNQTGGPIGTAHYYQFTMLGDQI